MAEDFDNLIRGAKPAVPVGAHARVLEHVEARVAVASAPAPWRVLLRAAALVLLAVFAGAVAALVSKPGPAATADSAARLAADLKALETRVAGLERGSGAGPLAALQDDVAELQGRRQVFEQSVMDVADARETRQREQWRQRHLEHLRRRNADEQAAKVAQLRLELGLTAEQEKEVRALLAETGRQAEELIGEIYNRHRRFDPRMHQKLADLAHETEEKLNALLNEQQRERMERPTGIVSSEPEDWAPRSDFRDATDLDVWTNWINVTRE